MRVLIITGDRRFGPGHERYELQRSVVEELEVVYWGKGNYWPQLPRGRFDVVTVQDPFFRGIFGWYAARSLGARFNVQVHADIVSQNFIKHVLAQIVLRHARSVRAVSQKIREQVEHIAPKVRVSILPVFIDVARFQALVPHPHDQKNILWIGRFEEEKDPLRAIAVLMEVRKTVDAKLIFLGAGSLEAKLKEAAQGLPVTFAGWGDPAEYLPNNDIVLSTSREESYGASIVEALAAGVPVIAPDVGIAKEAGAIVVPREDLAQAALEALTAGMRATLRIPVLTKAEWAAAWVQSLQ
jgi:glycosyltransferase involved in cell wall biosynthesis